MKTAAPKNRGILKNLLPWVSGNLSATYAAETREADAEDTKRCRFRDDSRFTRDEHELLCKAGASARSRVLH